MTLRLANAADVPALSELIAASVRGLQHEYSPSQREAALITVFGVDRQLIADGTYFAVEADGLIVGCGGWSKRRTLFGSDQHPDRQNAVLDPKVDAAKIRAFFIHPDWARRGIGSQVLAACERAAAAEGFSRFEMGATLTGVPLYEARGYVAEERLEVPLPNGETLPIVRMSRSEQAG